VIKHNTFVIRSLLLALEIDWESVIKHFIIIEELECIRVILHKIHESVGCETFFGGKFVNFVMAVDGDCACEPAELLLFSLVDPFAF
jgi:hypothetical protein